MNRKDELKIAETTAGVLLKHFGFIKTQIMTDHIRNDDKKLNSFVIQTMKECFELGFLMGVKHGR